MLVRGSGGYVNAVERWFERGRAMLSSGEGAGRIMHANGPLARPGKPSAVMAALLLALATVPGGCGPSSTVIDTSDEAARKAVMQKRVDVKPGSAARPRNANAKANRRP